MRQRFVTLFLYLFQEFNVWTNNIHVHGPPQWCSNVCMCLSRSVPLLKSFALHGVCPYFLLAVKSLTSDFIYIHHTSLLYLCMLCWLTDLHLLYEFAACLQVMMNSMNVPSKRSTLERKLDKLILLLFCILFMICFIGAIGRLVSFCPFIDNFSCEVWSALLTDLLTFIFLCSLRVSRFLNSKVLEHSLATFILK